EVGGHERPLPAGAAPPGFPDVLGQAHRLAPTELHHGLPGAAEPCSGPGDRAGKADAGEGAAGHGEIAGRLAVAMDALKAFHIMVERIGAAASGIEQHPEEPAVVLRSPADIVEHD